jgi:hypothetical protein
MSAFTEIIEKMEMDKTVAFNTLSIFIKKSFFIKNI